jgi:hypothetical protein
MPVGNFWPGSGGFWHALRFRPGGEAFWHADGTF